jgi:two-component system LytT family sensor kinase
MKIRWREHEAVLISIIAATLMGKYIFDMLGMPGFRFDMLIPQLLTVVMLWLSYFWVNRSIIPGLMDGQNRVWKISLAISQLFLVAYLLGPVINFASFYLKTDHQTETLQFPFVFGQHPQPFLNTFGGLGTVLFFLSIYHVYALIRELTIRHLQQPDRSNALTIVVVNETTLFFLRLLSPPIFTSIFNLVSEPLYYNLYYACLLPTQAVFLTNKFFLFPLKRDKSFVTWQVAGPLMFVSFIYAIVFSVTLGQYWSVINVCLIWALQLIFVIPISWLDYKQDRNKVLSLRGMEKELVRSKADLQLLRMQINPHFLFNVLNTIYGTALMEGAHKTAESTQKLGDMMRFMIHENTMDYIALDKEIAYLRNYIDLQKLRIQPSADICIEDQIDYDYSELKIAPMLLIPFVENAFKHGIDLAETSFINIQLRITNGILNYEVSNSIHKLRSEDYEKDNSGIGLNNVEQRLKLFYPGRHHLSDDAQGNTYTSKLTIDLNHMMQHKK